MQIFLFNQIELKNLAEFFVEKVHNIHIRTYILLWSKWLDLQLVNTNCIPSNLIFFKFWWWYHHSPHLMWSARFSQWCVIDLLRFIQLTSFLRYRWSRRRGLLHRGERPQFLHLLKTCRPITSHYSGADSSRGSRFGSASGRTWQLHPRGRRGGACGGRRLRQPIDGLADGWLARGLGSV